MHRAPPAARTRRFGGHVGRSLAEGDVHRESGALPRRAFHSKLAFHKIEHVAHDGEPESRALNARSRGVALPFEGHEHALHERGLHPYALIGHDEAEAGEALGHAGVLGHADAHGAASRRVLDGVVHQLGEHVGQAHGIHEHAIVGQRLNVAGQGDVGAVRQIHHVHARLQNQLGKRAFRLGQLHMARFHAADLQRLVHHVEQLLGSGQHFVAVGAHPLGLATMGRDERRVAHHGVQRRADVVGHVREERVFRHVGGLGLGKGVAQHGTVLEFAGIGLAQLGVHRLQLVGPLAQLVRGVVDEHVEELARAQRDVVAVVLYPTHRAVAADDAVLHVVHGVPVGLNLTADGVLHGLDVLGVHHAGEGAARQRDELLLVSAAEDAQAGLVDVDHRLVAIGMVDEKAAWHMSENVADVELG